MLAVINDTGILVVLVAVVLLFGASRIPKLARNLGEASREFKSAQDDMRTDPVPPAHALPPKAETVTLTRAEVDALRYAAANPASSDRPSC